jgi:diguanylate cyclase (GGDEF)-like protein
VLREFGARILNVCREDDMLARYGGEEFCLVLSGMNHEYGLEMAERCRAAIANAPFDTTVGPLHVTASFGMEYFDGGDAASILSSPVKLLERADKRLYDAKKSGRNRVCG